MLDINPFRYTRFDHRFEPVSLTYEDQDKTQEKFRLAP